MKIYIHTINGEPGVFLDGQIGYMGRGYSKDNKAARSLKQIRKDQKASDAYRAANGWDFTDYGYVVVEVPDTMSLTAGKASRRVDK